MFYLNFDFKVTWLVLTKWVKMFGRLNLLTFFPSWTIRLGGWTLVWVTKHKFSLSLEKSLYLLYFLYTQFLLWLLLYMHQEALRKWRRPFCSYWKRKFQPLLSVFSLTELPVFSPGTPEYPTSSLVIAAKVILFFVPIRLADITSQI